MPNLTQTESIFVDASPEAVWDYTQDYSHRPEWDGAIASAEVLDPGPPPRVRIKGSGIAAVFEYKQYDRPRRTSLAMVDVTSRWFEGGGGSWSYEAEGSGTRWSQTNTLVLKDGLRGRLMRAAIPWYLAASTRRAMREAKNRIEGQAAGGGGNDGL